jgi:hypothetical protein
VIADADESSLASFRVGAAAVERLRIRTGGWKAEAGGTTLEMDPILEDVTTRGIGTFLFLRQ